MSLIRDVIERMIDEGLLIRSGGQYPVLSISGELDRYLSSGSRMTVKVKRASKKSKTLSKQAPPTLRMSPADEALYERLRKFRRETAEKRGVPAYVIFTDSTLREIAVSRPRNMLALMKIRGIGEEKAYRYGSAVIDLVWGED